ncbi:MAG: MFS transporter, partial [Luminiphilus sp.]
MLRRLLRILFMRSLFFALTPLLIPMALQAQPEAFPSTYEAPSGPPVLFKNATILTGDGRRLDDTDLYIANGQIQWVGAGEIAPDATAVDASDRWITPGLIDVHSHLGVYPSPGVAAHSDGNEATAPVTAEVWAEHSVWPQDPGFSRALAGGVTAMQILPGSANLFGGRGVTLKNVPSISYQGMKFPEAPHGLKMACGENPKRVYGGRTQAPSTRMGNVAAYRSAWIRAQRYQADWDRYNQAVKDAAEAAENDSSGASVASALLTNTPPRRNLELDTLAGALRGDILVHMHCYRADEMLTILDMAEEFGYDAAAEGGALASFFVGYATTQVLGGWLALRFGPKRVLLTAVFLWSLATLLTPAAAAADFGA